MRTPGSTNQNTYFTLMAPPPPLFRSLTWAPRTALIHGPTHQSSPQRRHTVPPPERQTPIPLYCPTVLQMQIEKSKVQMQDLQLFTEIWPKFDPNASLLVPTHKLPVLLKELGPPLGIEKQYTRLELLKTVGGYHIPEHCGMIHFIETLIPLARKTMGVELTDQEMRYVPCPRLSGARPGEWGTKGFALVSFLSQSLAAWSLEWRLAVADRAY